MYQVIDVHKTFESTQEARATLYVLSVLLAAPRAILMSLACSPNSCAHQ